jgi:hypothetical protein
VALITHGESGYSRIAMPAPRWGDDATNSQYELVWGHAGPATGYGLLATRHMHEYGTTSEQMAEVAVATRKWASMNPKAMHRDPITVDDVLSSRIVAWPFHLLDCCLVTDGGGAVVVTSAERARDLAKPPVYVLGTGECVTHQMVSQMPSFVSWDAARIAGERAFAHGRGRPSDIDVVELYDAFTIVPMLALEELGFCKPGESGAFVRASGSARGRLPHEHQRRRAVVHPHGHVRHLHDHRGGAAAARRMRRAAGRRRQDGAVPRHGRHLERVGDDDLLDDRGTVETLGQDGRDEAIWVCFDAIDGTKKLAGIEPYDPTRLAAANDGAWAATFAFTAPTAKRFDDIVLGDFAAAAVVDGNPTRWRSYPRDVITLPRAGGGTSTVEIDAGVEHPVYTSSCERLERCWVFLDSFQAFDRDSARPGDERLAVELYRRLIDRHAPGGAYDVLRQFGSLSALCRTMLGWRGEPVWLESQGGAFIVVNENLPNLIPSVVVIAGAGGLSVDFEGRPLASRRLGEGRTSVVHAANAPLLDACLRVVAAAR